MYDFVTFCISASLILLNLWLTLPPKLSCYSISSSENLKWCTIVAINSTDFPLGKNRDLHFPNLTIVWPRTFGFNRSTSAMELNWNTPRLLCPAHNSSMGVSLDIAHWHGRGHGNLIMYISCWWHSNCKKGSKSYTPYSEGLLEHILIAHILLIGL